jgi:anthranilate synthase component II
MLLRWPMNFKQRNDMKILVIDNYDSFTYNLVHYLEEISGEKITVARNDEISIAEAALFDKILLSPGPGIPDEAGILKTLIAELAPVKSIIGICLGMQALAEVFGGELNNLVDTYHGVSTKIIVKDSDEILFKGLPLSFNGGRYHSWVVDEKTLPSCLKVVAVDDQNTIMGLRHADYDLCGVQFHPESVLTEYGKQILLNWLESGRPDFEFPELPTSNSKKYNDPNDFSNSLCC